MAKRVKKVSTDSLRKALLAKGHPRRKRAPRKVAKSAKAILKEAGLPVRKGRKRKARGPSVKTAKGVIPQSELKGPGLGGPNVDIRRVAVTGAPSFSFQPDEATEVKPPIPGHIERSHTEDASADAKLRTIYLGMALADMRAVRAAQLAYTHPSCSIEMSAPTRAEERVLEDLIENVRNQERAAAAEIIASWAKVFSEEVDQDAVWQLRMLLQRVRGPIWRKTVDNAAPGQSDGDEGFVSFRKTMAHSYKPERGEEPTSELFLAE